MPRKGYLVDVEWDEMTGLIESFDSLLAETIEAVETFMEELETSNSMSQEPPKSQVNAKVPRV